MTAALHLSCTEHCDEYHSYERVLTTDRDNLRDLIRALIEDHHRGHDRRFPWSLCSRDTCRDVAIALGVRA